MADVGINLTMTENISSLAPKMVDSLRSMGQAGQDMQDAMDLGDLEAQYKSFSDRQREIRTLFITQYEGPFKIDKDEVEKVNFKHLDIIQDEVEMGEMLFTDGFKISLEHYKEYILEK